MPVSKRPELVTVVQDNVDLRHDRPRQRPLQGFGARSRLGALAGKAAE
jgi:hypothetical protein